jgi:holliday junction DNA helicase RuvA
MYEYIKGRLIQKSPTHLVIENNGVGYFVNISLHTFSKLGQEEACTVFTHLNIKEDSHTLFGFADEAERRLFRLLISISGVGVGTARMLLSSLSPEEIESAILTGNVALLQSVKGIGGKSAQRIIIELKDKLNKGADQGITLIQTGSVKEDALAALVTLGFARNTAEKVLDQIVRNNKTEGTPTVEKLIKIALQSI